MGRLKIEIQSFGILYIHSELNERVMHICEDIPGQAVHLLVHD